jgi:hypothetical protein
MATKSVEEVKAAEIEEEERKAKELEEARLKEPVKAKLVRLLLALAQAQGGSAKKAAFDELEATVLGLKTEEVVGDSDVEKKAKEEREKAEKERKAAEAKETHPAAHAR